MKRYEVIEPILACYTKIMVATHLNGELHASWQAREKYLEVLRLAGWTEEQFDREMLRRIDAGWNITIPSPRGTHPMLARIFEMRAGLPPKRYLN